MLMNKPVCLGLSVLEISKILMYEFWYDYIKWKYDEVAKRCYMELCFIVCMKADDIYKDIADHLKLQIFENTKIWQFKFWIIKTIA